MYLHASTQLFFTMPPCRPDENCPAFGLYANYALGPMDHITRRNPGLSHQDMQLFVLSLLILTAQFHAINHVVHAFAPVMNHGHRARFSAVQRTRKPLQ